MTSGARQIALHQFPFCCFSQNQCHFDARGQWNRWRKCLR